MSLWAIVPVKPLLLGKSRLAAKLDETERISLNQKLYKNTLKVLLQVKEITNILIVSRDSDVLSYARNEGIRTVQENGSPNLNEALRRASLFAQMNSTEGIIIIPADLPLMTPKDIQEVIHAGSDPPMAVIVPDRRMEGTNALFINPADLITFSFGLDSFETHCHLIKDTKSTLKIIYNENIALDLDIPDDLNFYNSRIIAESMIEHSP
ncbi:MAG: 2-phospho-L-lactate guanylyltransferase [Anaerolineaceae bacterium]|nr:2-phospho-L-lactate guanylyltransferase [Anaerolineaceae bacterium]